eukprot:1323559-Rhodomonas_salina.3
MLGVSSGIMNTENDRRERYPGDFCSALGELSYAAPPRLREYLTTRTIPDSQMQPNLNSRAFRLELTVYLVGHVSIESPISE